MTAGAALPHPKTPIIIVFSDTSGSGGALSERSKMSLSASFSGFLAAAPETRITESGKPLTRFRVGVSDTFRDATGKFVERPTVWVNCQAWNDTAEAIRDANFTTGSAVVVIGQWRQSDWADKTTGEARSTRFVDVSNMGPDITIRKKGQKPAAGAAAQPAATAAAAEDEVNPL